MRTVTKVSDVDDISEMHPYTSHYPSWKIHI